MIISFTDPAKERLKEIIIYYKINASIRVAEKIKNIILDSVQILESHPLAGEEEKYLKHLKTS